MNPQLSRQEFWNRAALGGLAVAALPVINLFASMFLDIDSGDGTALRLAKNAAALLLWAAKLVGCIWILLAFMRRLNEDYRPGHGTIKRFGICMALLSALVCAAVQMGFTMTVNAERINEVFDATIQAAGGALDSNSIALLEAIKNHMPAFAFFSQLIYCFMFGMVASIIIAGRIVRANPVEEDSADNQEE